MKFPKSSLIHRSKFLEKKSLKIIKNVMKYMSSNNIVPIACGRLVYHIITSTPNIFMSMSGLSYLLTRQASIFVITSKPTKK